MRWSREMVKSSRNGRPKALLGHDGCCKRIIAVAIRETGALRDVVVLFPGEGGDSTGNVRS